MPGKGLSSSTNIVAGSPPGGESKCVDHLVQEIKENLKVSDFSESIAEWQQAVDNYTSYTKQRSCSKSNNVGVVHSRRHRPYAVPPSSRVACDTTTDSALKKWNQRRRYPSMNSAVVEDPFVMLQELISDGSLIKEAVRRLQLGLSPKLNTKTFYDSDDECRTPPAYPELCI